MKMRPVLILTESVQAGRRVLFISETLVSVHLEHDLEFSLLGMFDIKS